MDFDNRPYLTLSPAFSQIAEGGFAVFENCTWAALADTIFDYTGIRHQAPDLRLYDNELEHLGAYGGGESWERSLRVLAALHPDLAADTVVEYPGDVVAALHDYGARGYMVHWAGWCTPQAQWITTRPSNSISHAGRLEAGQGAWLALWNVWTGYSVSMPDSFWRASYDGGGILVFKRSLREVAFMAGISDQDQQVLIWRVAALVAGSPTVQGGPTAGEVNALAIATDFKALIWRVETVIGGLSAVADGPTKGELNQLQATLEAIKSAAGAGTPPDLSDIVKRLDAIAKHIGVGTP